MSLYQCENCGCMEKVLSGDKPLQAPPLSDFKWTDKDKAELDKALLLITMKVAHKKSSDNLDLVKGTWCSCFYCLEKFNGDDVKHYAGNDARCPKCGIDSVLPAVASDKFLKQMNDYWFGSK